MEWTPEQLAGQRLMAGFDGTALNRDLRFLIDMLKIAGIILFSRNISSPEQIKRLCRDVQDYAAACGQPPLLIAIDQEGGQVARLNPPFTQFPGNPSICNESGAIRFAETTARELKSVGINMNMAPVMDVADNNIDSVMGKRAFGSDPDRVSFLGCTVIDHLQQNGVMAVAKHFPGIGRTTLDSHLDQPLLDADTESIERFDLPPFEAAVRHNVAGIMLSHILYPRLDDRWPASLSEEIASKRLRIKMGYQGLVMTDDLDMGAIRGRYDIKTIMRQTSAAGIDLALICHKGPNIEKGFDELREIITGSPEAMEMGRLSARRIMAAKKRYIVGE